MVQDRSREVRLRLPPALQAEVRELIALSRTWAESAFGNAAAAATAAPTTTALLEACLSHGDCTVDELKAVVAARRRAQEQEGARPALRDLLLGEEGGLVLPQEPVKKERAAMVKRRAWLIARKQQREYNASVKNIRGLRPSEQAKKGMSEVRKTMKEVSIGFAMILVCVGVFFAFKLLADARGLSKGVGLTWGLFGAIMMLFVEMILFAIRTTRDETQERKKRRFMERNVNNIADHPVQPGVYRKMYPNNKRN